MDQLILCMLLCCGAFMDWKETRIPNGLCLFGMAAGALFQYRFQGIDGVIHGCLMAAVIFLVLLPLWLWGVLGGGDVKILMMAAFYLDERIFCLLALSGVCTAVYGLVLMISRRSFWERMRFFLEYIRLCVVEEELLRYPFDRRKEKDCVKAGVHVSYGVLAAFFLGKVLKLF